MIRARRRDGVMRTDDSFSSLAKKMGGDARHAAVLRALSRTVKREVNNASFEPRNSEVRSALRNLRTECDRFARALKRLDIWSLDKADVGIPNKAGNVIEAVRAMCDKALSMNPPQHGNPKPGMVACALIVREVWASLRKRPPSHNNDDAQEACEEYWLACGQAGGKAGRWEHHIKQALLKRRSKLNPHPWITQEVPRILDEGK